jgi:hypothetical protein
MTIKIHNFHFGLGLPSLSFSQVAIADEGLKQLQGLSDLEELHPGKAAVTDAGIAGLRAALSALEVRRQS